MEKATIIDGIEKPRHRRAYFSYLVCIWLVLISFVVIASMAVAVWSLIRTYDISMDQHACSDQISTEMSGEQTSDQTFDEISSSLATAIDSLKSEIGTLRQDVETFQTEMAQTSLGQISTVPAESCLEIFLSNISTPSGYYWVTNANGSVVNVYCDMTISCGGATGGWMRVAYFDVSNSGDLCPCGFKELNISGTCTCGIAGSVAACPSVIFSTSGEEYTTVCGKIIAHQYDTTDAFAAYGVRLTDNNVTIDSNYVDGVSLTYGDTPRNHIWTFVSAVSESGTKSTCECSNPDSTDFTPSPSFVGEDYFCDSIASVYSEDNFVNTNPLWDGAGCGSASTCCSFNNPPWFYKELESSTNDDIEMRVCVDEVPTSENIAISSVEIYVQ